LLTFIRTVNKPPPHKYFMMSVGLVAVNAGWQTKCFKFLQKIAPAIDRLVSFQVLCHTLGVIVVYTLQISQIYDY